MLNPLTQEVQVRELPSQLAQGEVQGVQLRMPPSRLPAMEPLWVAMYPGEQMRHWPRVAQKAQPVLQLAQEVPLR
jgi:hypothetical protein